MNKNQLKNMGLILVGVICLFQWRTWLKVVGMGLIAWGIVQIVKNKKQLEGQEPIVHSEQDKELNSQIGQLQVQIRLFRMLSYIGVGVGIVMCALNMLVPGLAVVLIVGGVFEIMRASQANKLKDLVSNNIVRQALDDVFDDITYEAHKHLPEQYIYGSNMGLANFYRIDGNDYVKGTYKGLAIEMSDITLIDKDLNIDEDGNQQESDCPVFQGLWLVCDFGKELSADMRLWESGKFAKIKGIKTENEQFNKRFYIESEIEHEAFYILTPHMMEYILAMKKKVGGRIHMCFTRTGKVQIAIDSGRDAFEVKKGEKDAVLLRQKFVREIRYVTDIIDELRLVNTFYKR